MRKPEELLEYEQQNKYMNVKKKLKKNELKEQPISREEQPLNKKAKWKQQSEQFRLAMKMGAGTVEENQAIQKKMQDMDIRKMCGFCSRKFNEDVFARHYNVCLAKSKNIKRLK